DFGPVSGRTSPLERRSLERDHELTDHVAVPRHTQLPGSDPGVGRPPVVGDGPVPVVAHVSDLDLVIGRTRFIGGPDLVTAAEGADGYALEANLGVVGEPAAERCPLPAAHGCVVGL